MRNPGKREEGRGKRTTLVATTNEPMRSVGVE
jgi:hypothetical protein